MRTIALVTLFTRLACAQITQHVTDLSIFNLLAPCASSAVSYNVEALTDSSGLGCGTDEARLQSCICSQSDVSSQVAQNVSEGVQSQCGKSATGDLWSASQVLKQYCSPGETITFSTPTTNVMMRYITAIDKMNFLAPNASKVTQPRHVHGSHYGDDEVELTQNLNDRGVNPRHIDRPSDEDDGFATRNVTQ
ncbi:hypothetical protein ACHAQH_009633 [Verticillium albo-atrum]